MQAIRRLGVPKWFEEISGSAEANGRQPVAAPNPQMSRLVLIPEVALSGDRIEMCHTQPILRRHGTLVLPCRNGSHCRIELRLLWTRFSPDQTYHTVGIIKWAWSLRLKPAPHLTRLGEVCREMQSQFSQ